MQEERRSTERCHWSVKKDGSLVVASFLFLEHGLGRLNPKSFFFGMNSEAFLKTKIIREIQVK